MFHGSSFHARPVQSWKTPWTGLAALLIRENFAGISNGVIPLYIQITSNNNKLCKVSPSVWSWVLLVPTVLWRWRSGWNFAHPTSEPLSFTLHISIAYESQVSMGKGPRGTTPPRNLTKIMNTCFTCCFKASTWSEIGSVPPLYTWVRWS